MPSEDWHTEKDVRDRIINFYNKKAKTPNLEMQEAAQELEIYLKRFEVTLRKSGLCKRLEYTDSSYEGLKITADGLEFDIMCVLPMDDVEVMNIELYPGFVNLHIKEDTKNEVLRNFTDFTSNVLSPQKVVSKYYTEINRVRSKLGQEEQNSMGLKIVGPAVRLLFHKGSGDIWFTADLVPSLELRRNGQFIMILFFSK